MKKIIYLIPFIAAILILSSLSCKTAPPPIGQPEDVIELTEESEPAPELAPAHELAFAPELVPVHKPARSIAANLRWGNFPASFSQASEVIEKTELETEPEPEQVTEQTLQAELDAAMARAEAARTRAHDFDCASYFPGDWEAAEEQYTLARQLLGDSSEDAGRAIDAYTASADSFDSLFNLIVPLYAQAREDEIMAIREFLIDQGIKEYFPEYLALADKTVILALEQLEAEDYYSAMETAACALRMFNVLTVGYNALSKKWEIDDMEFTSYDTGSYELAEAAIDQAMDAYNAGDLTKALSNAETADSYYSAVLLAWWTGYVEAYSAQAETERQAALDARADVGAREYFLLADLSNAAARELLEKQQYEEAARAFHHAQAMYAAAGTAAQEKRQAAAAAIMEANQRIQASNITALEAEAVIEGGS